MFFCGLLFLSLVTMSYLTAKLYAQIFISKIERTEGHTKNGLRDFILTQKNQISCFKKKDFKSFPIEKFFQTFS